MGKTYTVGKGVDKYIRTLEGVKTVTRPAIGMAIYEGAKVAADAIHTAIETLPADEITDVQRKGLLDGLGVTKIEDVGGVRDVKIGFDGYNDHITKKYPKGHPNAMIARSIISGTSWRQKDDFVGKAVRRCRAQAEKAMREELENQIAKVVNNGGN